MSENEAAEPVAFLTGATSGLGLATARALLARRDANWRVVIASRDAGAGARVVEELNRSVDRAAVECIQLDLGSLASVHRVGAEMRARKILIGAMICNAGLQFTREHGTAEGFEATFGINHLGHFALVKWLAPLMCPPADVSPR